MKVTKNQITLYDYAQVYNGSGIKVEQSAVESIMALDYYPARILNPVTMTIKGFVDVDVAIDSMSPSDVLILDERSHVSH